MTYWLLILILLTPTGHIKDVYYVEPPNGKPLKTLESCVEVQEVAAPHKPKNSILWCFHMKVPKPAYMIPINDLTLLRSSSHNKVEDLEAGSCWSFTPFRLARPSSIH